MVRRRWAELVLLGGCATIASATLALSAPVTSRALAAEAREQATTVLGIPYAPAVSTVRTTSQASLGALGGATAADPRIASEAAFNLFALTSGLLLALRTMLSELGTARPHTPRDDSTTARTAQHLRQLRTQASLGNERARYSAIAADAAGGPTGGADRRLKVARGECDPAGAI